MPALKHMAPNAVPVCTIPSRGRGKPPSSLVASKRGVAARNWRRTSAVVDRLSITTVGRGMLSSESGHLVLRRADFTGAAFVSKVVCFRG